MIVIVIYGHDVLYAEIAGENFCLLQVLGKTSAPDLELCRPRGY